MPWLSASMTVPTDAVEPLSDALMAAGALSVDVSDADAGTEWERPIFDEPDGARAGEWLRARVSALFDTDVDVQARVANAFEDAGVASAGEFDVTRVEDDDWVRRTQSQFT